MTQKDALNILKMGHSVFLTGAPGSGKTHTLRAYVDHLKGHDVPVAVTASTGIAATHLGGTTIHSWSGLGIRDTLTEYDIDILESRKYLWDRYQNTKVLIIDEISMLHHFRFDLLDRICRVFKRKDVPFGGMQVVLCGDFFQLPPVSRYGEPEAHFSYRSKVWGEMDLKVCYLSEQHRQNEDDFLSILNAIREDRVDDEVIEYLKKRADTALEANVVTTKLSSHNIDVDGVNDRELDKISGGGHIFNMTSHGKANFVETLKKSCLSPERLVLKVGARVMFVKNSFDKKYVNGTLGKIESFNGAGMPMVRTLNGKTIEATPVSWVIEEDGKIKAEISQVPLRLAWAITVHKSQGMSLDAAEIDLSKSFVAGQGYVALSRVRSIKGLKLVGFNQNALKVHPDVLDVDKSFVRKSKESEVYLEHLGKSEMEEKQKIFVVQNSQTKKQKEKALGTEEKTKLLIDQKLSLVKIAKARNLKQETIIDHLEKLKAENPKIDIDYLMEEAISEIGKPRFNKILKSFKDNIVKNKEIRLAPVKSALGADFSYFEIRLARLFLDSK